MTGVLLDSFEGAYTMACLLTPSTVQVITLGSGMDAAETRTAGVAIANNTRILRDVIALFSLMHAESFRGTRPTRSADNPAPRTSREGSLHRRLPGKCAFRHPPVPTAQSHAVSFRAGSRGCTFPDPRPFRYRSDRQAAVGIHSKHDARSSEPASSTSSKSRCCSHSRAFSSSPT